MASPVSGSKERERMREASSVSVTAGPEEAELIPMASDPSDLAFTRRSVRE